MAKACQSLINLLGYLYTTSQHQCKSKIVRTLKDLGLSLTHYNFNILPEVTPILTCKMSSTLPSMALYPEASWIAHLQPNEWETCLDSWISISGAHLSLLSSDFEQQSLKDDSVPAFLLTFVTRLAISEERSSIINSKMKCARKISFLLTHRLLNSKNPPNVLLNWEFLEDTRKVFGRNNACKLYSLVQEKHFSALESSLIPLRSDLVKQLNAGINGELMRVKARLNKLNHLLHALPDIATFFMTGSDFLDASIQGFRVMNPPLRKAIISNIYLCLTGLIKNKNPRLYLLADQLYSMKIAAESHKSGLLNANDSLVSELVSITPILRKLQQCVKSSDPGFSRINSALSSLESFRVFGRCTKGQMSTKRKIDKGKQKVTDVYDDRINLKENSEVQRMSLISQVQELLPDLGSAFVARLLDEYEDNVELVISHLLEGSLPTHLKKLDSAQSFGNTEDILSVTSSRLEKKLPVVPIRHNVFDNDEFDLLTVDPSRLHFGRRKTSMTAETLLNDSTSCPQKEAIYSALRAFDLDDDERDDTYDVADVAGTVEYRNIEDDIEAHTDSLFLSAHEETLYRAYKMNPEQFERDATTRRSKMRESLKEKLGLTDEVVEGWALMIKRDPKLLQKLEERFERPSNVQPILVAEAWRAGGTEDEHEESLVRTNTKTGQHRTRDITTYGRIKKNVAEGISHRDSKLMRRGSEALKGSRANHNRKAQRARKVLRGGISG